MTNSELEQLFGYSKAELLDADVEMLVPSEVRDAHAHLRAGYVQNPARRRMGEGKALKGLRKDGSLIHVAVSLSPVTLDDMTHTIAIVRDVTEQRSHERELVRAREEANAASAAKSAFVANMSHEIRTPMHGVIGWAEILSTLLDDDKQRQCLESLQQSASSLMALINDILDISKMDAGKLSLDMTAFDLHSLARDIHGATTVLAFRKPIEVKTIIELPEPFVIVGDLGRLRQVVLNLASNAVKFTDSGSVKITYEAAAPDLFITVEDTGIGIPDNDRGSLFTVFNQLETGATKRYSGTGLGLAITKKLSELMNGDVSFESSAAKGSKFRCRIPLKTGVIVPRSPAPVTSKLDGRVLIVDDNRVNLAIARRMAEDLGMDVYTADDGLQAVEFFAGGERVDIVLMDLSMPKLDGLQATRRLRDAGHTIPIIAISASALKSDVQGSIDSGMNDHLSKPFRKAALEAMLRRWLRR